MPDLYARTRVNSIQARVRSGSTLFERMKAKIARKPINDPPPLNAVVYNAKRFLLSYSSVIQEAPLQIYCSALTFSPEASTIQRLFVQQLPKGIVRLPVLSDDWSVHLQTLGHPTAVTAVAFSPAAGLSCRALRIIQSGSGMQRQGPSGASSRAIRAGAIPSPSRLTAGLLCRGSVTGRSGGGI